MHGWIIGGFRGHSIIALSHPFSAVCYWKEQFDNFIKFQVHVLHSFFKTQYWYLLWSRGIGGREIHWITCKNKWPAAWQNQQHDMCTQQRLRSAWASSQSDQSLQCALSLCGQQPFFMRTVWSESSLCTYFVRTATFLHADSKDSDQTGQKNAQVDLSLHWAHRLFCWFCCAAAQIGL